MIEIYICTLVAASGYLAWCILQSKLSFFKQKTLLSELLEISLIWFCPLLSITLYSASPLTLNVLILVPSIVLILTFPKKKQVSAITPSKNSTTAGSSSDKKIEAALKDYLPKLSFLTVYRGSMMIATCLAILAVDFKIFPRRFAKVETWGTSLMDLGVGSFVFSMGVVSARATLVDEFLNRKTTRFNAMMTSFKQALAVLTLGALRLLLVKSFDYQEHVTEYGIHWNFFFTLGLLPPFVSLLDFFPKKIPLASIAITIGVLYEILLNKGGLVAYIITAPRVSLISKNKEGIFSFIGYLSIFLLGKSTGYYTLPSFVSFKSYFYPQSFESIASQKSASTKNSRINKAYMLLASGTVLHILYYIARSYFKLTSSRRFANLCYILLVSAFNLSYLSVFLFTEAIIYGDLNAIPYNQLVPESLESVNANGLAIFLLANVTTGLINLNINTIDATKEMSIVILALYSLVLALVSLFLKRRGIIIKL